LNYAFHLPLRWIACAIAIDLVFGDPSWLPHPVRLIGWLIAAGDRRLNGRPKLLNLVNGAILTAFVVALSILATWMVVALAQRMDALAGAAAAALIAAATLALRGLDAAASAVEGDLRASNLGGARIAIRSLVGRDPDRLDSRGIIRAAIESLAENASDGFVAPLLFLVIAGPAGSMGYKAINTLDSMIGYRDKRYRYFGRVAARLDDFANLIPSRLTAMSIALASLVITGRCRESLRVCYNEGGKHASPNAGYPEAAMAGALGIELGGAAYYDGEVAMRPGFGSGVMPLSAETLRQARKVMWLACGCAALILLAIRLGVTKMISP
jgi:adenosylcobinamide-phosphate synthase